MNDDTAGSLATMFLVALTIAIFLLCMTTAAPARHPEKPSVCLTYKQARQLFPKKHLYWFSSGHCWSNRRGGPPRNLRYDLIKENHAESLPASSTPQTTHGAGKVDRAPIDASQPSRGTVRTIPIVKQTEWKNDFEDYCCWPSMENIFDSDKERAFRLLAEKLRREKESEAKRK